MTADALNDTTHTRSRSLTESKGSLADTLFRIALTAAASLVLLLIVAIMVLLFRGGLKALMAFGPPSS